MKRLFFLSVLLLTSNLIFTSPVPMNAKNERHIVVVTASYNNLKFWHKNISSVTSQHYDNYHVIYVDDCSNDGMSSLVQKYLHANSAFQDHILYIRNHNRQCALFNQYHAIHLCRDTDLIVMLDGDDWLIDTQVFSFLNGVYNDPNVWMTYGQFQDYPSGARGFCVPVPNHVVENNTFREWVHAPSHLKTFYAGLFHQINKEHLCDENDNFFEMTGDLAKMLPIIEMARFNFRFIPEMLMVYNYVNPLNDHKMSVNRQGDVAKIIRSRPRYNLIKTPFWLSESV